MSGTGTSNRKEFEIKYREIQRKRRISDMYYENGCRRASVEFKRRFAEIQSRRKLMNSYDGNTKTIAVF